VQAYIQNHVPHKSLKGITPFEAWCGKKPKVSHFRIFGCRAWAHIPSDKRRALEPQSVECIFFGYPEGVKGYRLLQTSTDSLFIERSVKFEEGPLHAVSDQPVGDFLDETVEEGFDAHSRTSDNDDEKVFGSYS
jgi:hypothetical protein